MNERIEAIKKHLVENRKVYIAAAVGAVVGATVVLIIVKYKLMGPGIKVIRVLSPGHEINNNMNVFINPLGDPGNVVQCLETGTVYASQGQAARELGVNASRISEHLTGKLPNINGNHLIFLGKAGQALVE